MLIRIRGGKAGIREYLQTGRKKGRIHSRDQLDKRVILHGDLLAAEKIYETAPGRGERYLHITISFREDTVPVDILREISNEFRDFVTAAYRNDEFYYYCEAHLPRIQAELDQKTGQMLQRKPHLHIVIPKVNLLTGQRLDPFGKVRRHIDYIDAFQEQMNSRYQLESPKDHRRLNITDRSEVISRYSGDFFRPIGRELKQQLLQKVCTCVDYNDFKTYLQTLGVLRERNSGADNAYLNLKRSQDKRGINLKEFVFTRKFLDQASKDRIRQLQNQLTQSALLQEQGTSSPVVSLEELLAEWKDLRSREVKYLNSGNRAQWKKYQAMDTQQRRQMLNELEDTFYKRWTPLEAELEGVDLYLPSEYKENLLQQADADESHDSGSRSNLQETAENTPDSEIGQLLRDAEKTTAYTSAYKKFQSMYVEKLDLQLLLNHLSQSHAIKIEDYKVRNEDGKNLIHMKDGRLLSGIDFLIEILHLSPDNALQLIQQVCNKTPQQQSNNQRIDYSSELWQEFACEKENALLKIERAKRANYEFAAKQRSILKTNYTENKRQIYNTYADNHAERKAALSVLNMEKVHRYEEIYNIQQLQNIELEADFAQKYKYSTWLFRKAEQDDEEALRELQRLRLWQNHWNDNHNATGPASPEINNTALLLQTLWSHAIKEDGSVIYHYKDNESLIDYGQRVEFVNNDQKVTETGLRFSLMKYGSNLHIYGSDDFKREVISATARMKLSLVFTDSWMNEELAAARKSEQRTKEKGRGQYFDRE
ncbi:LPD7 domain-containing protein [Spirochaeta dissipatitropha]